jgi:DNA repair protein RadC
MTSTSSAADALLVCEVGGQYRPARAEEVLSQARLGLAQCVRSNATMLSPQAVKDYLRLEIGVPEHEVFCVLFLDAQHRIIELKQMFRGTVTQTSVYPREVVKVALACNSAAVVLAHNHPAGSVEPSRADEFLTQTLKSALALVDPRTRASAAFAQRPLLQLGDPFGRQEAARTGVQARFDPFAQSLLGQSEARGVGVHAWDVQARDRLLSTKHAAEGGRRPSPLHPPALAARQDEFEPALGIAHQVVDGCHVHEAADSP